MSDDDDTDIDEDGEETAAEAPKKGGLMKKALMFGLPALILLLAGAGGFILFAGGGDDHAEVAEHGGDSHDGEARHAAPEHYVFYEMPELLVNINGGGGKTAFLKLKLNIEVADEALIAELDEKMPRVIDRYQGFLRELRPEDLSGSAGYYRLKLELLRRVNLAIAPAEAEAVNIDQMLIQ